MVIMCNVTQPAVYMQMKKVFSANPEATINVECIMNDIDVAGRLSRDIFEEKSASVLERARAPLQKVTPITLILRSLIQQMQHLSSMFLWDGHIDTIDQY
jgi:hypothetical protein